MKIIEVRNGIIKYETADEADLASFIKINNQVNDYIAQVIRVVYNGAGNTVYAKILFNYDGEFLPYDNSIGSENLTIEDFDTDNLLKLIEVPGMTALGKLSVSDKIFRINSEFMNNKSLLCADNKDSVYNIISNISANDSKTLIIDTIGISDENKIVAGKDYKIPLNSVALNYIYSECISDATDESKSIVKDIFNNLSEYSLSVPFLPFNALKNVVDNMISTTHDFRVMVLKNKLAKFQKVNCFASEQNELCDIKALTENLPKFINFSQLLPDIQNLYLQSLADDLSKTDTTVQIIAVMNNKISKKTISSFYNSDLRTLFAVNSSFRYLKGIKSLFKDFILEANPANCDCFSNYKPLFSSMKDNEFLVAGTDTNNIPFIISTEKLSGKIEKTDREELISSLGEEIDGLEETVNENTEEEIVSEQQAEGEDENEQEQETEPVIDPEAPVSLFDDDEFHTKVDDTKIEEETESEEGTEDNINNETLEDTNTDDAVEDNETISEIEEPGETEEIEETEEEIVQDNPEDTTFVEFDSKEIDSEILDEIESAGNTESEQFDEVSVQEIENREDNEEQQVETDEVITPEVLLPEQEEPDTVPVEEPTPEDYDVIPLDSENDNEDLEIVELDSSETSDDDIIVELETDESQADENEELDKEIIEDVDKVFTTVKEDTISDVDLDLIDELNELDSNVIYEPTEINNGASDDDSLDSEFEELEIQPDEEDTLDEPLTELSDNLEPANDTEILETKSSSTPIVPVYDAEIPPEDMVSSDPVEQGDTVIHAKYGTGVVEKMIKYGNKNLYSINFENVGRRLLDPALTEIKKA